MTDTNVLLHNLPYLIWGVTIVYAIVSVGFLFAKSYNDAVLFGGYAVANLGAMKVFS